MLTPDEFIKRLSCYGRADPAEFVGCSEDEIMEIEKSAGFSLPESYKKFLRMAGRYAGAYLKHVAMFYPQVMDVNRVIKNDYPQFFESPDSVFVFLNDDHACYFLYFLADDGDDPPIYGWASDDETVCKKHNSFWDFIESTMAIYER